MIMYSTRARVVGPIPEAMAWAQKIAELVTKTTGLPIDVAARVGGHSDILWVSRVDDMAALEKLLGQVQGDSAYQAEVKSVLEKGLFDSSTLETAIWQML